MNIPGRFSTFSRELDLIHTSSIRSLTEYCLATVPDYFFTAPASSSGKYHPTYALGEGGLVRHTKAAVAIFRELVKADVPMWYQYIDRDSLGIPLDAQEINDICVPALILHDTFKLGVPSPDGKIHEHSCHEHPLLAAQHVEQAISKFHFTLHESEVVSMIPYVIASHMGKWNLSPYSSYILPAPTSWIARLVHLCDYLASRKYIEIQTEVNNNRA